MHSFHIGQLIFSSIFVALGMIASAVYLLAEPGHHPWQFRLYKAAVMNLAAFLPCVLMINSMSEVAVCLQLSSIPFGFIWYRLAVHYQNIESDAYLRN